MIWTVTGATLVLYEWWAIARGHTTISEGAHRLPWALLVWGWWLSLAIHFLAETPTRKGGTT